ncbi:hypothetical protein RB595_001807 [Gaeumannomyces hyphopodioides]
MVLPIFLLGLAPAAAGSVLPRQRTDAGYCGMVSTEAKAQTQDLAVVPPSVALNCLHSIEVDTRRDVGLIDYLSPFLEELSTLGYLKSPPPGYLVPGVDLVGAMGEMRKKLVDGKYSSQYQFISELRNVFNAASEGHLFYLPGLLSALQFARGAPIVSASSDGIQPPKIYLMTDMLKGASAGFTPSEVTEIDGEPVQSVLRAASFYVPTQDPDTKYNELFGKGSKSGQFVTGLRELRDNTTFKFANNTIRTLPNYAIFARNEMRIWNNISTGADVHQEFELPGGSSSAESLSHEKRHLENPLLAHQRPLARRQSPKDALSGKEEIVEKDPWDTTFGIFLGGESKYRDTCVLRVLTFAPDENRNVTDAMHRREMRRLVRSLTKKCKDSGRTKLVVDLQGNGGGSFWPGLEMYRNLFPKSEAFQAIRWRATPALQHYSASLWGTRFEQDLWGGVKTMKFTNFSSSGELFGPDKTVKQDSVTNRALIDARTTDDGAFTLMGFDTSDTGAPQEPPFKPEDVIVVTDGSCASTCAGIAGLMTREAGVRSIAMGGRPQEKPMQAIGGTRGGEVRQLDFLQKFSGAATMPRPPSGVKLHPTTAPPLEPTVLSGVASINWYNEYPIGAPADAPPLQFVYEAAHCRRFFRPENVRDPQTVWQDVADVAWRGAKCVKGSTVNADQTIPAKGGLENTPPYSDAVRFEAKYTGPGAVNNGLAPSGTPPVWRSGTGAGATGSDAKKDAAGSLRASAVAVMAVAAGAAAMLWA